MRIYVATGFDNIARGREVIAAFRASGHAITFDWPATGPQGQSGESLQQAAENELAGVRNADVVVALLPGGRGTHAEIGMALAFDKPTVIVAETNTFPVDNTTCCFYHHPNVLRMVYKLDTAERAASFVMMVETFWRGFNHAD